jgi:hypothetical protein
VTSNPTIYEVFNRLAKVIPTTQETKHQHAHFGEKSAATSS